MTVIATAALSLIVMISTIVSFHFKQRSQVRLRLKSINSTWLKEDFAAQSILKKRTRLKQVWLYKRITRLDSLFTQRDRALLLFLVVATFLVTYLLLVQSSLTTKLVLPLLSGILSTSLLYFVRRRQQIEEFEQGISQVLGLVSRAVSAGLSVPQAIEQVAIHHAGLMGREFQSIRDNLQLGISLRQTLDEACIRLPYAGFRYFCVALLLNQSSGGQLRDILMGLGRTMHDNRAMRKKVKSLTSEPRMTAMFLSCLPIILMSILAWRDSSMIVLLTETETGQSILMYVVGSILTGMLVLSALTKNKRFM